MASLLIKAFEALTSIIGESSLNHILRTVRPIGGCTNALLRASSAMLDNQSIHFLPAATASIQDADALALLRQLRRSVVQVMLPQKHVSIATAYIHQSALTSFTKSSNAPIVLLHGFDSSLLEFRRLLPCFIADRDVWAIDLLGFGFTEYNSDLSINPFTIRQHLHAVWQRINQPIVLVGASMGGAVAIDFALKYPNCVQSLVLIDSVGLSGNFPIGPFLSAPVLGWSVEWLAFRKQMALQLAQVFPWTDSGLVDAIRCSLVHQQMPTWRQAIASFTRSGGYAFSPEDLTTIQPPTLILWGESDDMLGTDDADRFHRAIPRSELHWITAGHVPHFEQPQSVADRIQQFLITRSQHV
ncbi:alpha/beta fold hydrolase [Thermocoleostomius sinensis]|uniref:Alpha/beta hydrolase n=1 Tax=Thermocoleostomius sinensis A174 TaxID=2016057 RepID=A0A9E8ZFI2_9CYAN|nr:alpha/beta hydrolase [Thermocoleostomius sinensis]WAL62424.1 alpha/beta hydrolase [Thermocoleostomius sinensis A174]